MKIKLLLGFVAILCAGCKYDRVQERVNTIDVSGTVSDVVKSVVSGTKFQENDAIGLYVVAWKDASNSGVFREEGNYRDNLKYVSNADGVLTAADKVSAVYPNAYVKVDVYAVSPYSTNRISLKTVDNKQYYQFSVVADQTTEANFIASDLMTACKLAVLPGASPASVDLTFTHRLSKVTVLIAKPNTYKGDNITSVESVILKNVYTKAEVAVSDAGSTSSTAGNVMLNKRDETNSNSIQFAGICATSSAKISYEVDVVLKGTNKYTFTYQGQMKFEPSKNHTLSITTFEDERVVTLGGGVINSWSDAGKIEGGEIYEKGVDESFSMASILVAVNKVKVKCDDGYTYELPAVKDSQNKVTFNFTGEFGKSPERYPYTITSVELYNDATKTGGGVLTTPCKVTTKASSVVNITAAFTTV